MQHFPIFLDLQGRRVIVAGGGDAALAKLRLLLKTEARLTVFATDPAPEIRTWATEGRLTLIERRTGPGDALCAALFYTANEDDAEDALAAALARADGALVNIVDNLQDSAFITPAIVDRDPVTVAIGTEGAAPVLARAIKADLEERLPASLGTLARIGKAFRGAAESLPFGEPRRRFWRDYYFDAGPRALARGAEHVQTMLQALLDRSLARKPRDPFVEFVGAGPGDPELLTLKARKALDRADVVIHDRLVPQTILELARREATIIDAGKEGFGPSMPQADITALILTHATDGAHVVRLKGGDPGVFGRLEEEIEAVGAAGIAYGIVPGITAAAAATASLGRSLTRRGRNGALRIVTGHDAQGFADQDWAALAKPGAVTAIYMGKRAARFLQGRLLMHGANPATPISVVENASHPGERILPTTLGGLSTDLDAAALTGPAVILLGLAPADAAALPALPQLEEALS